MPVQNNEPQSWQQNLRAIWFAELMAIVGFYVVIPILPLYIRELGVQADREIRLWSGAIFSAQQQSLDLREAGSIIRLQPTSVVWSSRAPQNEAASR